MPEEKKRKVFPDAESEEYRKVYGLPLNALVQCSLPEAKDPNCENYVLETCEPLKNDPHLDQAGVELCARTIVTKNEGVKNRMALRRCGSDKEGVIDCVHTAVWTGAPGDLPEDAEVLARSTEQKPLSLAQLSPKDHFVALALYARGIAETGITNMFALARESGAAPFGFNALMQSQFLQAIGQVAPHAQMDISFRIAEDYLHLPYEWLYDRFRILEQSGHFITTISTRQFLESLSPPDAAKAISLPYKVIRHFLEIAINRYPDIKEKAQQAIDAWRDATRTVSNLLGPQVAAEVERIFLLPS